MIPRPSLRRGSRPRPLALACALLLALPGAHAWAAEGPSVAIDGRLDDPAWAGAQVFDDFVVVEPWTLATPDPALKTVARVLPTPAGLAIGFDLHQPADVPLRAPQVARDEMVNADRVNVFIDFDGDGRVGYNFTVLASGSIQDSAITSEVLFNADFDPDWRHAVATTPTGWRAEILIPWTTVALRGGGAPERTQRQHEDPGGA